jgi:GMP synthase (glutamine-hydrolysing)
VFVDHGLMRMGEAEQVVSLFRNHYNIPLVHVDAEAMFLGGLAGLTDPEAKRKFIGAAFIDCSRPRPTRSAAPISSPRARSIPT